MNKLKKLTTLLIILGPLMVFPGSTKACGKYCVHPGMQHGNVQGSYPIYGMYPMYGMSPMYGMGMYPLYGMSPMYGVGTYPLYGMSPMYGTYSMNTNLPHPHAIRGCVH